MSALTVEQVVASHKANLETLFGLTTKAFEGVEKIVELNLTASKAALTEVAGHANSVLSVKDVQELLALQSGLIQPLADKAASYNRHLYDIASGTSAEFAKAFEGQATEAQKKFVEMVETAAKNAPAGSESAVEAFKESLNVVLNAAGTVKKAVQQAAELVESNVASVTNVAKTTAPKSRAKN
jgi:phasin family protein